VSFQAGNALQSAVWFRLFVSGRQKEPPHPGRLFAVLGSLSERQPPALLVEKKML